MSDSWTPPGDTSPPPGPPVPGPPVPPGPPAQQPAYPSYPTYPTGQPTGQPTYATQPISYQPPPALPYLAGAAHKPGAVPLRPLGLSDIYDAAFKVIRHNPAATVGAAVLVSAAAMALPVVVTAVLTATSSLSLESSGADPFGGAEVAAVVGSFGALALAVVLQGFGNLLVTGLIVQVVMGAALGRTMGLGEAWAATRGTRGRLVLSVLAMAVVYTVPLLVYVGLWVAVAVSADTAVIVVWGLVTVPTFLALMVWLHTRLVHLAVPALVVERIGVLAALGRAWRLSRGQFWRIFGILLLTTLITAIAAQVLSTPISLGLQVVLTGLDPSYVVLGLVLTQALSSVVSAAFVTPFTAAVSSLQYLDQRMRKEAFDVELMQRAGITER